MMGKLKSEISNTSCVELTSSLIACWILILHSKSLEYSFIMIIDRIMKWAYTLCQSICCHFQCIRTHLYKRNEVLWYIIWIWFFTRHKWWKSFCKIAVTKYKGTWDYLFWNIFKYKGNNKWITKYLDVWHIGFFCYVISSLTPSSLRWWTSRWKNEK